MESYAIVSSPSAFLYEVPAEEKEDTENGGSVSAVADEVFCGTPVKIAMNAGEYVKVVTPYGYAGYALSDHLAFTSDRADIQSFLGDNLHMVTARFADVLSKPSVKGKILTTLKFGCAVPVVEDPYVPEGWVHVISLDAGDGYVAAGHLGKKLWQENFLWEDCEKSLARLKKAGLRDPAEEGGSGFDLKAFLDQNYSGDEDAFRGDLTSTALRFLDTQYRWGGRSFEGIDCSGLVFSSYLACGVTVFRDAALAEGFALRRLKDAVPETGLVRQEFLRPGDALYFPGHVAMYLGEGMYIHSTAKAGSDGVVLSSLDPADEAYREDLHRQLYAAGGLR